MGFFDPANPEQRQENDFQQMIELLKEIRDMMKNYIDREQNQIQ